jgi:hypothetical protein
VRLTCAGGCWTSAGHARDAVASNGSNYLAAQIGDAAGAAAPNG